jgi:hypothetical protein
MNCSYSDSRGEENKGRKNEQRVLLNNSMVICKKIYGKMKFQIIVILFGQSVAGKREIVRFTLEETYNQRLK